MILDSLLGLDLWSYDIFLIEERSLGNPLFYLMFSLFHKYDLFDRLQIDEATFQRCVCGIEAGYRASVPYHNSTHGTHDVMPRTRPALVMVLELPLAINVTVLNDCVHACVQRLMWLNLCIFSLPLWICLNI
jgi:hypothetical protein